MLLCLQQLIFIENSDLFLSKTFFIYFFRRIAIFNTFPTNQLIITLSNNGLMQPDFQCTKIKDGLYLATLPAVQDYQFLHINKFSYIVNCAAQIPNYFESNIKYLKFKLVRQRAHKLWDESLKKLRKLQKFVEEAEENSLCCVIFSAGGNSRSLVMLVALLMSKYRWTLSRVLEFVRSKHVFIGLSEHYIGQLEVLQGILNGMENMPRLSSGWRGPYLSQEEELIAKTFLNSQEMSNEVGLQKIKKEKRVSWQDRIDKQKKKQSKEKKVKGVQLQFFKKSNKNIQKLQDVGSMSHMNIVRQRQSSESPLKQSQAQKKQKKVTKPKIVKKIDSMGQIRKEKQYQSDPLPISKEKTIHVQKTANIQQSTKLTSQDINPQPSKAKYFNEQQLLNIIKNNLKIKKSAQKLQKQNQPHQQKQVYRLTINNFISPNINFMNPIAPPAQSSAQKPPKSKQNDKPARAISQKETQPVTDIRLKKTKGTKIVSNQKGRDASPLVGGKKRQKVGSIQFCS